MSITATTTRAAATAHYPGGVCQDCEAWLANGTLPEVEWLDGRTVAEWLQAVQADNGCADVTLGLLFSDHIEGCGGHEDRSCTCENADFSTVPCDLCGTSLGGYRASATFWYVP